MGRIGSSTFLVTQDREGAGRDGEGCSIDYAINYCSEEG